MFQSPDPATRSLRGKKRVLVVDDEPTLAFGFSFALQNERTTVDIAPSGPSALEMAAREEYDAVFLDFRMPEMNGIEVLRALRERGATMPVVMCSAFFTADAVLSAVSLCVADFVLKPVRPADLREALEHVIEPPSSGLAGALAVLREGRFGEAMDRLAGLDSPEARLWREVIAASREGGGHLSIPGVDLASRLASCAAQRDIGQLEG